MNRAKAAQKRAIIRKKAKSRPRKTAAMRKRVASKTYLTSKKTRQKVAKPANWDGLIHEVLLRMNRFAKLAKKKPKRYIPVLTITGIAIVGVGLWRARQPIPFPEPVKVDRVDTRPVTFAPAMTVAQPKIIETTPDPAEFVQISGKAMGDRIRYWSQWLSKDSSIKSVISWGSAPQIRDTAPIISSQFDCTTFVETVSALARSRSRNEFYKNLISIRYRNGNATFEERNHFPELDWVPNNEKAENLKDITLLLANRSGVASPAAGKQIDREKWIAAHLDSGGNKRTVASRNETVGPRLAQIHYIKVEDLPRILDRIPDGAIVNLVRKNLDNHPSLITHQGFVFQENGKTIFRHASTKGMIKSVPLMEYIQLLATYSEYASWPVIGVNINQLTGE